MPAVQSGTSGASLCIARHLRALRAGKSGHIGDAVRPRLGDKEYVRRDRRRARPVHLSPGIDACGPIVIFHVTEQQVTEVALAEYNNVVKAFPSDRTDYPFSISILPRGARRRRSIADAYRSEPADKNLTISAVPVTNEIAGSLFPAACFRDLICDPFCGWMRCDAKPQNMSPAVPHDQQSIVQAKRDCRQDEHVHRSDP